ncbi:MAG: hypothetical protein ACJ74G_22040 [Blastocatellia bacterium]
MKLTKRMAGLMTRMLGRTPRRAALSLLGALMVASLNWNGAAQQTAPRAAAAIWSGTSAGYAIQWTGADITGRPASGAATLTFSVRQIARRDFAAIEKDSDGHCEYERNFTLLSVVGPIISYQDNVNVFCERAAHPDGETRFVAVDLSKPAGVRRGSDDTQLPGNVAKLTDYFPASEIHKALLADPLIQKALDGKRPRTIPELMKLIGEAFPTVAESEKSCFTLAGDLLTRFAFHHVEGNKVAVRLGLSGTGVCRDNLTQIGLLLPIPASLQESIAKAEAGSEGFLTNRKVGAGRQATFKAATKKRPSRQ